MTKQQQINKYENLSEKFLVKTFDYQKQFSHLYSHRFDEMFKLLSQRAAEHWNNKYPIRQLCDLKEEQEETCIIIGTIYKCQVHKPSILREISEENQLDPQPPREHYAEPGDKIILEDTIQRVRLRGIESKTIATGVVCAALGRIHENGFYDVDEVIFYESGPQRPLPQQINKSRLIVLVSGLSETESLNYFPSLNIFQHWLSNNLPFKTHKASLVRLIVAGNSAQRTAEKRTTAGTSALQTQTNDMIKSMQTLDTWFASWAGSIAVDVMPGMYDPANFMLPQQPFHSCIFPQASKTKNFQSVPNPYACTVDDTYIVGCSGQNVQDLLRSTEIDNPLIALRSTLTWSHIAPTAPDTLACYPYITSDPFILKECPHIYFTGNCDNFDTELLQMSNGRKTRLICVPSFAKTKSVAVVDLENLDCHQVCFNVEID